MNTSPQSAPQGAPNNVIDLNKARLEKELKAKLEKEGVKALASFLVKPLSKLRNFEKVQSLHAELMELKQSSPEALRELLDALAKRTVDRGWWEDFKTKFKLVLPLGIFKVPYELISDYSYAGMIMLGVIGDREIQDYFASHAEPGALEKIIVGILPWIAKIDPDPDTLAIIETVLMVAKGKGLILELAKQTRALMPEFEVITPEVESASEQINEEAHKAQLPVEGDKKLPGAIQVEHALGPETANNNQYSKKASNE